MAKDYTGLLAVGCWLLGDSYCHTCCRPQYEALDDDTAPRRSSHLNGRDRNSLSSLTYGRATGPLGCQAVRGPGAGTGQGQSRGEGGREVASSAQHHQGDRPTSSRGPVRMGKEHRAVCSGGLVVEVEAAVWLKSGLSPSRVEEVVDEVLHHGRVYLTMVETKRAEGHWHADIQCPISH